MEGSKKINVLYTTSEILRLSRQQLGSKDKYGEWRLAGPPSPPLPHRGFAGDVSLTVGLLNGSLRTR